MGYAPSLVDVALPVPVDKVFTYLIPGALASRLQPGCRVLVPFGPRRMTGYVISFRKRSPGKIKLREVSALVDDEPLLNDSLFQLARWMANYYVHSLGEVLRAMLPAGVRGRGRLPLEDETEGRFPREAAFPELTPDQHAAFEAVTSAISRGEYESFLLHGVTGSGKTEVYLRCIGETLRMGKSALILIPEIALIPQTTSRFRRRFGREIAVLHSRLTGAQRCAIWQGTARGEIRVVIGARSAVFVPLKDLGIIVIDEEQDTSFKQEEKPHYNAVTVARRRAELEGAALLLGSATPALETYEEAQEEKIAYFKLHSRPTGIRMPEVEMIDMRGKQEIFSEELLTAIETALRHQEQAIVLLNRRGHATFIQCRSCGWIERCPNCSISLTYHSRGNRLICHYCAYRSEPPEICPTCGAYGMIHRGIGTQRIEMELGNLLPGVRVARMDLDTTRGRRGHLTILEQFSRREKDILLGTQMVAKGHHYPNVTIVGVLSADWGLNFPDFRAAERTFRLLSQAAGRTGRGEKKGMVIVQTYAPDHFMYRYLVNHDYEGFAGQELALRYELGYPPAQSIALFTISSPSRENAYRGGEHVSSGVRRVLAKRGCEVLGPTPALVEKLRGKYRLQVLVKCDLDSGARKRIVKAARASLSSLRRIDLQWDFDPIHIY